MPGGDRKSRADAVPGGAGSLAGRGRGLKIRHLTDVSICNLQQCLYCNYPDKIQYQQLDWIFPGLARRVTCAVPDRLKPARQGNQMETMASICPTVLDPRRISLTAGSGQAPQPSPYSAAVTYLPEPSGIGRAGSADHITPSVH